MASKAPKQVCMWAFPHAPLEFQELFPEGAEADWVVYVPPAQRKVMEPSLLRWRGVYPVKSTELPDRSAVYWGAPREAMRLVTEQGTSPTAGTPPGKERRAAVRVHVVYPSRYETHTEPQQAGAGHTIDMSNAGIAFTTESLLPANAEVTLHVTWPVRLEGDIPVELRAIGKVVRAEAMRAALKLDRMTVSIVE